jgi:hypothetical protein
MEPPQGSLHATSGSFVDEISIVERHLDDPGLSYVALSYVWGEPGFDARLFVREQGEKRIFKATKNAWDAVNAILLAWLTHPARRHIFGSTKSVLTKKMCRKDRIR